jgi:16S rRNA processing protein RimM
MRFRVGIFLFPKSSMNLEQCYKVGYILRSHGLKGEVTVSLDPECPSGLESVNSIFLEENSKLIPYFIEHAAVRGDKAYIKFEEVNSAEAASQISRRAVYLPKSSRISSGRGNFYDDEILDFEVVDDVHGTLGKVTKVTQAGPNKLVAVGYMNKEVLIPVNGPFITGVNKSKKRISVSLPDGFLDI